MEPCVMFIAFSEQLWRVFSGSNELPVLFGLSQAPVVLFTTFHVMILNHLLHMTVKLAPGGCSPKVPEFCRPGAVTISTPLFMLARANVIRISPLLLLSRYLVLLATLTIHRTTSSLRKMIELW